MLPCCRIVCGSATRLRVFQKEPIFIGSYASKSSLVAEKDKIREKDRSFTVMYLINPCGLSIDDAVSASKKVHFDSPERPDSVFNLFKHYGVGDISPVLLGDAQGCS